MSQVRPSRTNIATPRAGHDTLDDSAAMELLSVGDAVSVLQLAEWLKAHVRTFSPVVSEALQKHPDLSPEAAGAVLDAMALRAPDSGEVTLRLLTCCLEAIASRLTESLSVAPSHGIDDRDDVLLTSAVATLTCNQPARRSEAAVHCLAEAGPGGARVLARSFDAVRGGLKLRILGSLIPANVLALEDNVIVSLAHSVSAFAEGLEGHDSIVAHRFLAELGPVGDSQNLKIGVTEVIEAGDGVFHASWGSGTVLAADDESVTIDFGGAGTRTLLRALATLRRA